MENTHRRYSRRSLLAKQRAMELLMEAVSDDRATDVPDNGLARNKKSIKYKSYKHSPKAKLHLKKFKLKVT